MTHCIEHAQIEAKFQNEWSLGKRYQILGRKQGADDPLMQLQPSDLQRKGARARKEEEDIG
jgi:hypothetical protein